MPTYETGASDVCISIVLRHFIIDCCKSFVFGEKTDFVLRFPFHYDVCDLQVICTSLIMYININDFLMSTSYRISILLKVYIRSCLVAILSHINFIHTKSLYNNSYAYITLDHLLLNLF